MGSARITMTLRVRQKKPIKPLIELDPEDLEDAQDIGGNVGDKARPAPPVTASPQGINEFKKQEMKKSRTVVKNKLNEWHDCLLIMYQNQLKMLQARSF